MHIRNSLPIPRYRPIYSVLILIVGLLSSVSCLKKIAHKPVTISIRRIELTNIGDLTVFPESMEQSLKNKVIEFLDTHSCFEVHEKNNKLPSGEVVITYLYAITDKDGRAVQTIDKGLLYSAMSIEVAIDFSEGYPEIIRTVVTETVPYETSHSTLESECRELFYRNVKTGILRIAQKITIRFADENGLMEYLHRWSLLDTEVLYYLIERIGEERIQRALPQLHTLIEKNRNDRVALLKLIGAISLLKREESIPVLVKLLDYSVDEMIVNASLNAIELIDGKEGIHYLKILSETSIYEFVRKKARELLEKKRAVR